MRQLALVCDFLQGTVDFIGKHGSFNGRHVGNCLVAGFILFTVLDGCGSRWRVAGRRLSSLSKKAAAPFSLACVGMLLASSLVYAVTCGISDHIESTVLSVSSLWGQGKQLYPSINNAECYGWLYGPLAYMTNSAAISLFGPDVRVAKLLGLAFLCAGLLLLGAAVKRGGAVFICWGYAAIGLLVLERSLLCRPVASWVRSDAQLVFWASFGLFSATRKNMVAAVLGVGLAMGMCVNLKLHGAAYVFPALAFVYRGWGIRSLAICLAWAGVIAAMPFVAFSNVSLRSYLELLSMSTRHGMTRDGLCLIGQYALFLLSPVVAVFCTNLVASREGGFRSCLREQGPLVAVALLATVLIAVPASKPGAGPYHLVPLVPSYAFLLGQFIAWPRGAGTGAQRWSVAPRWVLHAALSAGCMFAVVGGCEAICCAYTVCGISRHYHQIARTARDEIARIRGRYPQARIAMGYGSLDKYEWTFYRTTLPSTGAPYLLDAAIIMDLEKAGLSIPDATRRAVCDGQVDIWLVPAGDEPFAMSSYYVGGPPLFDRQFRDEFAACYRRQHGTEHFDLWVYRGGDANSVGARPGATLRTAERDKREAGK